MVVGAGLAGACAALYLSRTQRVLVLEGDRPAAGASGAAAGLVNPLTGLRARPVWRMAEALDAFGDALDRADARALYRDAGILRPAGDADQADRFRAAADAHPDHARWLTAEAAHACHPHLPPGHGALLVRTGGAIDVPAFVEALLAAAVRQGADVRTGVRVTGWDERRDGVHVRTDAGGAVGGRLLLALGAGYAAFPALAALRLHPVKGQTVRVTRPYADAPLPHLSGSGYVVDEGDALVLGSTYEHTFTDARPTPAQTEALLARAVEMVPALRRAEVVGAQAGVRVNVPGTRLPMVGPVPGHAAVWVFTGLGSKGLLMAPLLARGLAAFFETPATIPPEVRVRRAEPRREKR